MKKIYLIGSLVMLLGLVSCNEWLNVNVDPDTPNAESATLDSRLPWMQYYYGYAWGVSNTRGSAVAQMVTGTSRTGAVGYLSNWNPQQGAIVTTYQNWYTGVVSNLPYLLEKAEAEGAWHYLGAGLVLKSMGYIMMSDLCSESPYTYAGGESYAPLHDTGETIYQGCLEDLDKALEYFDMNQEVTAPSLASGDCWNGGNINQWKKLAYGLKARWLNNLSKTGQYNPQEILAALEKAPQSNAENVIMKHQNVESATYNYQSGDAYGPNVTWDSFAWGTGQRLTRWYVNLLTNFKNTGVLDPRADKLIPSSMYKVELNAANTEIISYEWLRDEGVDMANIEEGWRMNRLVSGNLNAYLKLATDDVEKKYAVESIERYYTSADAFVAAAKKYYSDHNITVVQGADTVKITYHPGAMYVDDVAPNYVEDIKYVQMRADALFETAGLSKTDMNCYYSAVSANTRALGFVQGTGGFYTRPDSDSDLLTYTEMCFIKAEVYFRQGNTDGAYNAYIEGIRSHFARLNQKLSEWQGSGACTTARGFDVSFAYAPIPDADIEAYMSSAAVAQSAGALTMSDIMMQKYIAMGPNYQNYNDMRRYNFYVPGQFGVVYTELNDPAYRLGDYSTFDPNPSSINHFPRRFMQCSHETNYNATNTNNMTQELYGLQALDYSIWSIPVWWDRE